MRLLIGLGSKARHGKDSAAKAIQDFYDCKRTTASAHGYGIKIPEVKIFKFAEGVYAEAREQGMTDKDAPLLQKIGMQRRIEDKDYWIKKVTRQLDKFDGIALITDVRFFNEALMIKERGGFLLNVLRLNGDGKPFVAADRPADHPSETDLDNYVWDYFVRTFTGQEALAGELAITIAEHLMGITVHG